MNKELQDKVDTQIEKGNVPDKPKRFRVVEVSDAPVLTDKLIKKKGKKTYTVECVFDDEIFSIEVRRGMPLEFAILLQVTAEVYALAEKPNTKTQDADKAEKPKRTEEESRVAEEGDRKIKQITVSSMVVRTVKKTKKIVPIFSFNGKGGKIPIEDQSDKFLKMLYDAVMAVNAPEGSADALSRFQELGEDGSGESDDS